MKRPLSVRRILVLFLMVFFAFAWNGCGGDRPVKPSRQAPTSKERTTNVKPVKPIVEEDEEEEVDDQDLEVDDTELEPVEEEG
jgi:hypothetical protein